MGMTWKMEEKSLECPTNLKDLLICDGSEDDVIRKPTIKLKTFIVLVARVRSSNLSSRIWRKMD